MKSSKPEAIKLPYASTVANYANDQGAPRASLLGSLFKKGEPPTPASRINTGAGMLK